TRRSIKSVVPTAEVDFRVSEEPTAEPPMIVAEVRLDPSVSAPAPVSVTLVVARILPDTVSALAPPVKSKMLATVDPPLLATALNIEPVDVIGKKSVPVAPNCTPAAKPSALVFLSSA